MSQQTSGRPPVAATDSPTGTSAPTTQVARDEAAQVGRTGAEAGRQVAETAAHQAGEVAQEARRQARNLVGEARGQVVEQARNGQQKATDGLRAFAGELHEMAGSGGSQGTAAELARQAADRVGGVADWLSRREPGDLLEEVRGLARRRPGAFLVGAAFAGVLVGRLTRGAVDANRVTGGSGGSPSPYPAAETPAGYPAEPPPSSYAPQPWAPQGPIGGAGGAPPPPAPGPTTPGGYPTPGGPAPGGPGGGYPGGSGPLPSGPLPSGPLPSGPGVPGAGHPPAVPPYVPPGPAHAPHPGARTVGEYVDDAERGAPRHEEPYPGEPRPGERR